MVKDSHCEAKTLRGNLGEQAEMTSSFSGTPAGAIEMLFGRLVMTDPKSAQESMVNLNALLLEGLERQDNTQEQSMKTDLRHVTVIHLVSASTGEQRFERDVSREPEAFDVALKHAHALISNGEPVTLWKTQDFRTDNQPSQSSVK